MTTDKGDNYEVKNMALADQGLKIIEWARRHMPVLQILKEQFHKDQPFKGNKIGACLHVTKETAILALILKEAGADLYLCASNPLSTTDEVAAGLAKEGIKVFAWRDMDNEGYYRSLANVLNAEPDITIDDGADLVSSIHKMKRGESGAEIDIIKKYLTVDGSKIIDNVIGGAEETTTGIIRLRAMAEDKALLYPILATNNLTVKWEFDNLWGTGQSTIDGILRATADLIAGSVFVTAGYGHCGRGVALRAKGLGARRVIATEIDPFRVLTAMMEGIECLPMLEAAKIGDFFVTATGCKHVITYEHMLEMKDGAVLCNTGHFDIEIDLKTLREKAVKKESLRENTVQYTLENGKTITILAEGRLVNLSAAEGHPAQVMDLSFSGQLLAANYIVKNKDKLKSDSPRVIDLPHEIDLKIAKLKCESMGIKYDILTPEQQKYLTSWQEGTE
ncbi:MAG: adenosylhomocysteinase [Candidatus Hodarchaeales archaeon]|jgi:adenosylhomocysteinase